MACAFAAVLLLTSLPALASDTSASQNARDAAEAQFDKAQTLRASLESSPESRRILSQYQELVKSYRKVYLLSASAKDVPLAIMTVGDLNRKMGQLFDPKFYQAAIEAYQYLQREYPTSRYREDALLAIGQIQNDDLHDAALAQKTFEEFLQVDTARRQFLARVPDDGARAREAAGKVMWSIAGDLPDFEEASRALFACDRVRFEALIETWPPDVRDYAKTLAAPSFVDARRGVPVTA